MSSGVARGCVGTTCDERAAAAAAWLWRCVHVPVLEVRKIAGKQAGRVDGLTMNTLCRSEGEAEGRRRVVDGQPKLQAEVQWHLKCQIQPGNGRN